MHPRWPAFVSRVYPEKQPAICWWIRIPYARLIHDHSWCVLRASFEFLITLVVALIFSTGVATADFSSPSTSPEKITPAPISSAESSVALERDEHPSIKGTVFGPPAPRLTAKDYPDPLGESRVAVWVLAQQHLYWAAFLLGTLLIVSVLEIIALIRRDEHDAYACDVLAREFLDLVMLGLSVASLLGGTLLFCLLGLYPDLMRYLLSVSRSVFLTYGILVLGFTILAYLYYVTWESFDTGCQKWIHASLGILANVSGTSLAFLGNSWSSFMISPAGIDSHGRFLGNTWRVIHTALWNPLNVHRLAGHLLCAGAVLAAYGAYRCLTAKTTEEKAHFDWIGSVALFALLGALFTMPFGGYWLLREIYAYRQQMGITLLGGLLAWPGILLVSAMSLQFLGINYYLWQRISSVRGGSLHVREAKWVFFLLGLCTVVYISPHTMVMTPLELKNLGGQQHPVLGNYGVESAKSTAVNLMMVLTTWSFLLWQLTHTRMPTERCHGLLRILRTIFVVAAINILWLGVYGYYIPANGRVGLSVPMVMTTLSLILVGLITAIRLPKDTRLKVDWGSLPIRGYFALLFIAFLVTWTMGLGGYRRSALRLFWHVNDIMQDESPWAFTHTTGFATNVISLNALLFWISLAGVFWLTRTGVANRRNPQALRGKSLGVDIV